MLRRVRAALGRDEGVATTPDPPAPPRVDPDLVRLSDAGDDLPAMFTQRATAVGMRVHRVSPADAAAKVVQLLRGGTNPSVSPSRPVGWTTSWG